MSEESIILELESWLDRKKYTFRINRCFIYGWECDFWAMDQNGITREFEIKISKQDFLIDKKKEKHADSTRGANYFYYVCPAELIAKDEVDKRYGLIWVYDDPYKSPKIVKKPTRLHDHKFAQWKMLANKMFWKWYSLWWSKYSAKEITRDEWKSGFNLDLEMDLAKGQ